MLYARLLSENPLVLLSAIAALSAWPFRRKDEAPADDAEPPAQDEDGPQIDHLEWGLRLGMLERYERAAERFRMAAQADPDDPTARYNLALALDLSGQHDEARSLYTQIAEQLPDLPDVHINLALAAYDMNDYAFAEQCLRTAIQETPDDAVPHFDLGCVYAAQRRWADAAAEFRLSAQYDPKDAQIRFNFAIALRLSGKTDDAEKDLRDFLALARGRWPDRRAYVEDLLRTEYEDTGETDAT